MNNIENKSKAISKTDDSAAQLLIDVLGKDGGRNFDIESIFAERKNDGMWRWIIYEFLKADTIPPQVSHPNYYWYKNKRKFLSLWTMTNVFRKAGFECDLILVNYAKDEALGIKEMIVKSIETEPSDNFKDGYIDGNGIKKEAILNHIKTIDKKMSFNAWKKKFRDFNKYKKGDTWEILNELEDFASLSSVYGVVQTKSEQTICEYNNCDAILSEKVYDFSIKNFNGKSYCFKCQQLIKNMSSIKESFQI